MSAASTMKRRIRVLAILCIACAGVMMAQVTTQTTQQKGQATSQTTVERGVVVYVSGNDVVIRMETGEIRHFTVPDNARGIVDGKEIGLADLRPGMKLQRTITTTTTPKTVQTVRAGTGTVVRANPPNYVTVRFEDGSVEQYKIPKGTKFTIEGQPKTAFELRPGMKISATRVITSQAMDVSQQRSITGTGPAPVALETPPIEGVLLIAEPAPSTSVATTAPRPAPALEPAPATEPAPKKLPKTGSVIPLIGLLGALFCGASFGVRLLRRS